MIRAIAIWLALLCALGCKAPTHYGGPVPFPAPGDAGTVLTSNGPGLTPGWQVSQGGGSSIPPGPDLKGDGGTVIGIQTVPVATTTPLQSYVPVFDTSVSEYSIRQLTQDDIAAGFSISSFTGGSTVELGATVTNPVFTASYSHTPNSAQITNSDSVDSPLTLSSPFTSGTIVGSFSHSSVATVTVTLTAVSTSTKTANSNIVFLGRTFSGVGTAGATGATASGTTAVLAGATGTLAGTSPDGGLFSSIVGQTFGSFSPSSQKIYVLTPHTSTAHVFHDQNGFGFPMNSPTTFSFTNVNSATISMDLYESTNSLSTTFSLTVIS